MTFINELKQFDSLHDRWVTFAKRESDHAFETHMHGDDNDIDGLERCVWRKSLKDKGSGNGYSYSLIVDHSEH